MKIDQNRVGGQNNQAKSAKNSEKTGKNHDKKRAGDEAKAFKQIFAKTSKKTQPAKAAGADQTKSDKTNEKSALNSGDTGLTKDTPELDRDGLKQAQMKDQGAQSEFDVEKQRLSEVGKELQKLEVDEQAVLAGTVPEMTDGTGIQQAAQAAPAAGTDRAEMAHLADKIVQAFYVGQDARAKKIVMMDVNVPGRGSVRVRLSKNGESVDVRMRADNEDLARLIRAHREDLRESGASKGVNFGNIEVVG